MAGLDNPIVHLVELRADAIEAFDDLTAAYALVLHRRHALPVFP